MSEFTANPRKSLFCASLSKPFGLLVAIMAAYLLLMPQNRSESEDGYRYSWQVESMPARENLHRHHVLYHPMMCFVYKSLQLLGWSGRAHPVLIGVSMVSAATVLMMLACMMREMGGLSTRGAVLGAACLACMYGFWRYAVEAEIYLPAMALILAAWCARLKSRNMQGVLLTGILAAIATGVHLLAGAILPALVISWLTRREWKSALLFGSVAAAMIIIFYVPAYMPPNSLAPKHATGEATSINKESLLSKLTAIPGNIAKAPVGLGQAVAGTHFIFGFEALRNKVKQLFPARMLEEEMYLGERMPRYLVVLALIGLFAIGVTSLYCAIKLWSGRKERLGPLPEAYRGVRWGVLLQLMISGVAVICFEPANAEMWILILPLGMLVVWPLLVRRMEGASLSPLVAMVSSLAFLNIAGGALPMKNEQSDYQKAQTVGLERLVSQGDWIATMDNSTIEMYIRGKYGDDVEVVQLLGADVESLDALLKTIPEGRSLWLLDSVFHPSPSLMLRFPDAAEKYESVVTILRSGAEPAGDDELEYPVMKWHAPVQ